MSSGAVSSTPEPVPSEKVTELLYAGSRSKVRYPERVLHGNSEKRRHSHAPLL